MRINTRISHQRWDDQSMLFCPLSRNSGGNNNNISTAHYCICPVCLFGSDRTSTHAASVFVISRPRVARAGTNKLKCQKNLPTGSHLTQISAGVPNLNDFLNLNNFGQNGQNWKIFVAIIKPARWGFRGKKSFFDFDLFWPRSEQNCEPTLKSA